MAQKNIATLIKQEVKKPAENAEPTGAIATTKTTPLADLQLSTKGLFEESKALWAEFVAFDKEHQLTQKVGAQLWRLTQAVGKPALVLSFKGIQSAIVAITDSDSRAALMERFNRSELAKGKEASLSPTND